MNQPYYNAARLAAQLEQAKQYRDAAKAWRHAKRLARKSVNIDWCYNRSLFCMGVGQRLELAEKSKEAA